MKRIFSVFFLGATLLFNVVIYAQEFAVSDSIYHFQNLSENKQFLQAGKLAFKIADYYTEHRDFPVAKNFYNLSRTNAAKASNTLLEARATYKRGMTEKRMAESGNYSMDEEQQHYKDCIKSLKKAYVLFGKSKMQGSYEYVMALINGGEAQFIIGEFKGAVSALKTALVHAERNRYNDLALKSSNLLFQCFAELDDKASETYYRSIYKNYQDFFISKDSLARSLESLDMSKDSLAQKKAEIIKIEIAKLKEIQKLDSLNLIEKNLLEAENEQDKLYLWSGIGVVLIF